jgi:hypothetical protein
MNCNPPTRDKIICAIIKMKNGKPAGPDGIPADALMTTADICYY